MALIYVLAGMASLYVLGNIIDGTYKWGKPVPVKVSIVDDQRKYLRNY